jgi:hypothetical protein
VERFKLITNYYQFTVFMFLNSSQDISMDIVMGYETDCCRFDSQLRQDISLYSTASRQDLGSTQPLIQWVPGALSWGKTAGREADHSPPLVPRSPHLLSTGSTLTLPLHFQILHVMIWLQVCQGEPTGLSKFLLYCIVIEMSAINRRRQTVHERI